MQEIGDVLKRKIMLGEYSDSIIFKYFGRQ